VRAVWFWLFEQQRCGVSHAKSRAISARRWPAQAPQFSRVEDAPRAEAALLAGARMADDMKKPEEPSEQFLKLLDIVQRQKHIIDQWRRAEAQGPTDSQLWEVELAKLTAELHSLMLKGITPDQLRDFNEALAVKSKAKDDDG
jgi:hypothetical protein